MKIDSSPVSRLPAEMLWHILALTREDTAIYTTWDLPNWGKLEGSNLLCTEVQKWYRNLGLVCKRWKEEISADDTLVIGSPGQSLAVLDHFKKKPSTRGARTSQPSSSLRPAPAFHHLVIKVRISDYLHEKIPTQQICEKYIDPLLSMLTNLTSLIIESSLDSIMPSKSTISLIGKMSKLVVLGLSSVGVDRAYQLSNALQKLSKLRTLSLKFYSHDLGSDYDPNVKPLLSALILDNLQTLHLSFDDGGPSIEHLLIQSRGLETLFVHALDFGRYNDDLHAIVNHLASGWGTKLKTFILHQNFLSQDWPTQAQVQQMCKCLIHLEHLSLPCFPTPEIVSLVCELPRLKTLCLWGRFARTEEIERFFLNLPPTLESLTLEFGSERVTPSPRPPAEDGNFSISEGCS
ncbi:hypothetical protein T439DRAFT_328770 [Meredithblackwellia eburnea MCA 4105]